MNASYLFRKIYPKLIGDCAYISMLNKENENICEESS